MAHSTNHKPIPLNAPAEPPNSALPPRTVSSASWMNMVETWFSILTKQQVRRGVYHVAAIETFIERYNQRAQPFVWTKTADQILEKATPK